MRPPRAVAALVAGALVAAALLAAAAVAARVASRHVHALAPQMFAQKHQGVALQRAAFRQPDLLPLYGSSDLNVPDRYHASAVLRDYPTGFTVFPVGNLGASSLIWLQALAAVGADLRGERVALSVPLRSFMAAQVDRHAYAANFSPLHAGALAFSPRLGLAVKQAAARRMLDYPETLANRPLLRFAVERLADGSPGALALYYASLPLGLLHNLVLRLQDHWETLAFVGAQVGLGPVARQPGALDWAELRRRAERDSRLAADGNPFGFENAFWAAHAAELTRQRDALATDAAARDVGRSAEWIDFDLLLDVIAELGGRPLVLVVPLNGAYYDYLGLPEPVRREYYERLRAAAAARGATLVDFADHDGDRHFTVDSSFHLSGAGWMHYATALDAFFHGRLASP